MEVTSDPKYFGETRLKQPNGPGGGSFFTTPNFAGLSRINKIFLNGKYYTGTKPFSDIFIHEFTHVQYPNLAGSADLHKSGFYKAVIALAEKLGRTPHPSEIDALRRALEEEEKAQAGVSESASASNSGIDTKANGPSKSPTNEHSSNDRNSQNSAVGMSTDDASNAALSGTGGLY